METLSINTPALLFPATSLLMLAYTNRYLALARIIRDLADKLLHHEQADLRKQINGLSYRLTLIKYMQACGILALLFCLLSMLSIFLEQVMLGGAIFGIAVLLLALSLLVCLVEVLLSGNALRVVLQNTLRNSLERKM